MRAVAVSLLILLLAGCSGITPYQPRNNREEGPEQGLFTGSKGAFEIGFGGSDKPTNPH